MDKKINKSEKTMVQKVQKKEKKEKNPLDALIEENEKIRKALIKSFRNERKEANEKLMKSFCSDHQSLNVAMANRVDLLQKKSERQFNHIFKSINDAHGVIMKTMKDFTFKVECMEESILAVYHNIKRNQFLYAYEPEEILKTFDEIKKKILAENKEFKKVVNQ